MFFRYASSFGKQAALNCNIVTRRQRGRHDPLYAIFILTGIFATFKAYPTLSDPGLFFTMTALFPETFPCKFHNSRIWFYHDSNFRPSISDRHYTSSPPRISSAPSIQPPMAGSGHWERKFLLCFHLGIWCGKWRGPDRLRLGWPENCDGRRESWVHCSPTMTTGDFPRTMSLDLLTTMNPFRTSTNNATIILLMEIDVALAFECVVRNGQIILFSRAIALSLH
jgi:hypothetical protein